MPPALRTEPLLFREFPELARQTPWLPLAHVPTAVEPCDAIAAWLGRSSGVFMKRDDLVSPLYGGNKVRRYEFLLSDARARGKKRIVTVGGLASTQAMATALFGRAMGFDVRLVLFDQPVTSFALDSVRGFVAAGAEVIYGGGYAMTAFLAYRAYQRDVAENYFIAPGAAGALANLGYLDAMLELAGQVERGEVPRPDVIVLPTGSSGTLAALALGAAYVGWETEIVGVRITTALATNRLSVGHVIRNTDRVLQSREPRWKPQRHRVRYLLYGGALGPGYGHPTPEAIEGAAQVERLTGAYGEVTYSGKALAGLRALLAEPRYRRKVFLFWNTLSTPRPPVIDPAVPLPPSLQWMTRAPCVAR
ncbi:MAG TPA: pyridoxal-phosphate dependent enzyme [Labilithrix sp.]|nr:pyridoxal-phosphate dependent enzyme [Labilithrix sp.]